MNMEIKKSPLHHEIYVVFIKDVKSELRTKIAANAILLFALTTLFLISYVIGPYRIASADQPYILSAWLWVIFFFSAMSGLSRVFVKEEETNTSIALQLAARPEAVFLGKFFFNLVLMLGIALVITPLYVILMEFPIRSVYNFGLIIFLGLIGMTTGVTIIGAIVAKASMKGTLFPILSFPIIIPLLLAVIEGTSMTARSASFAQTMQLTSVIIAFTGAMFVLSLLLFEKVWLE